MFSEDDEIYLDDEGNEIIVTNNTSIKIESNLITAILGTSQI